MWLASWEKNTAQQKHGVVVDIIMKVGQQCILAAMKANSTLLGRELPAGGETVSFTYTQHG